LQGKRRGIACAKVEQHGQQVGVVHGTVAVQVSGVQPRRPKVEQHAQQVGVVYAAVAVYIAVGDDAGREPEAAREAEPAPCERITGVGLPHRAAEVEGSAHGEGNAATVDRPPGEVIPAAGLGVRGNSKQRRQR
jgi:hypothetical protein